MSKAKQNPNDANATRRDFIGAPAAIGNLLDGVIPLTEEARGNWPQRFNTEREAEIMQDRQAVLERLIVSAPPKTPDDALAQIVVAGGRIACAFVDCDYSGAERPDSFHATAKRDLVRLLHGLAAFMEENGAKIGTNVRDYYLPDDRNPHMIEQKALAKA